MATLTLECGSNDPIEVEVSDTYTFKSKGVEIDFELADLCEEALARLWWHAKRWITDGSKADTDEAEHGAYINSKLDMLRGHRAFGAVRSGDAVAREMKPFVINALAKAGTKRDSIPALGSTASEVKIRALSLGLSLELVDKIRERAEAIAELKADPDLEI